MLSRVATARDRARLRLGQCLDGNRPWLPRSRPRPSQLSQPAGRPRFSAYLAHSQSRPPARAARPASPSPRPAQAAATPTTAPASRNLATDASYASLYDPYLPFEGVPVRPPPGSQTPSWHPLHHAPVSHERIVLLPDETEDSLFGPVRRSINNIFADPKVVIENLHALLRVRRFAQAEKTITRLATLYPVDAPEVMAAHESYLTTRLQHLLEAPNRNTYVSMQKWFELDIRGHHVTPSSVLLAILVKASFAVLEKGQLDRTIRRYLNIAGDIGEDVREDLLSSNLLLDSEMNYILRLFPNEFEAPVEEADVIPALELKSADTPDVLSAEQRGYGLQTLKDSLKNLSSNVDYDDPMVDAKLIQLQRQIEQDSTASALEKWRLEAEDEHSRQAQLQGAVASRQLGPFVHGWVQDMAAFIRKELELAEESELQDHGPLKGDRLLLTAFLAATEAEKICAAAVIAYISTVAVKRKDEKIPFRTLTKDAVHIGRAVLTEIHQQHATRDFLQRYHGLPSKMKMMKLKQYLKSSRGRPRVMGRRSSRSEVEALAESASPDALASLQTNSVLAIKLGSLLLSTLLKCAKLPVTVEDETTGQTVTEVQPIVSISNKWHHGKSYSVLQPNQAFVDRLKKEPVGAYFTKLLPMVIKPRPWKSITEGPYLTVPLSAVRVTGDAHAQKRYMDVATKAGYMQQTFNALDVLGQLPWKVNKQLFAVMTDAWNTGEAIGGFAPHHPPDNWPPRPSDDDRAALTQWNYVVRKLQNERTGMHSQRCFQNFQMEVARAFLDSVFYTPHNVDFRGRAYPVPPYFNHMGADTVRGLFLFADGRKLGPDGLRWVRIQLANTYGFDKASLDEREKFAVDHMGDIVDSVSDPLGGRRWWLTAEDPWQCLAACMELVSALESGNPEEYVSHLPIQQDGTCNGLQHYAALGGDEVGALQVNLVPGNKPADIYSAVAHSVSAEVDKLAADGNELAQIIKGKITRKVVKQPVMTNVYGVTQRGAKEQVLKQLQDVLPKEIMDERQTPHKLAMLIGGLIFKILSQMFGGAHAIQSWLGECGAIVSRSLTREQIDRLRKRKAVKGASESETKSKTKSHVDDGDHHFRSAIVWTTPLGMPVVQPYRVVKPKIVRTTLHNFSIRESTRNDPISKRKQLQAFPPNFIHSLDATHMMLSALECNERGLSFAAVHDSFWTHASTIGEMNGILRNAFVRIHSEDVVGRLREELVVRYRSGMHAMTLPGVGKLAAKIKSLRLKHGRRTASFRAGTKIDPAAIEEMLEEVERLTLLKSSDPEKRAQGAKMVTPASLWERYGAQHSSQAPRHEPIDVDAVLEGAADAADADADADLESATFDVPDEEPEPEPKKARKAKASRAGAASRSQPKFFVWVPTAFPPAPQRGSFAVETLMKSTYFFS